ncbi:hypothetical protein GCM10023188_06550 [Pontibacter saemangeumensis]|uniref:Tetratricopeptide repeat-containing protein n=1 Tax=Pontibacter saemangeumensis TaxID=1084525 RepID=A0ABP8LAW5_9BACT
MKPLLLLLFVASIFNGGLNVISRINEYSRRAAAAYAQGAYLEAVTAYRYLVHDLQVHDEQLQLNLAHASYRAGLWAEAQEEYGLLANYDNRRLRAVASLQLGNIATKQRKYRQALALFKAALVAAPENDAARYNYELLRKYIALHPETPEDTPEKEQHAPEEGQGADSLASPPPAGELEPQPKKKPDANGTTEEEIEQPAPAANGRQQQSAGADRQDNGRSTPGGEQERAQESGREAGETEGINPEGQPDSGQQQRGSSAEGVSEGDARAQMRRTRLQQMNMSPEKARLLLDAMRNAELQYLQQLPKKSSKAPDPSKPDW